MAKVSFVKNFKDNVKETKTVKFGDVEFKIFQYLPVIDKITIIKSCVDNSFDEEQKYDAALGDVSFNYYLAKFYTDLKVEDEVTKMYDILKSSGLMDCIIENIPKSEINFLKENIEDRLSEEFISIERENSFVNVVKKFLAEINGSIPKGIEALENFDPSKLEVLKEMWNFESGTLKTGKNKQDNKKKN